MSVGCDEGAFRFPGECDAVITPSSCVFCDAVTKISATERKCKFQRANVKEKFILLLLSDAVTRQS